MRVAVLRAYDLNAQGAGTSIQFFDAHKGPYGLRLK